jgi:hypothetical protein
MQNPTQQHPNASLAAGSSSLGVVIVWLSGHFGLDMTAEVAASVTGLIAAGALVLGRNGLRGLMRILWHGNQPPVV